MLDLKWIRSHPHELNKNLIKRGHKPIAFELLELDKRHRQAMLQLQEIRTEKNRMDGEIAALGAANAQSLIAEASSLKMQEEKIATGVQRDREMLLAELVQLPNLLDASVPEGQGEEDNVELHRWGAPKSAPWMKDHVTIGRKLDGMDFQQAAKISGPRFVYLKGEIARLERALSNWMLDVHTQEFGFTELRTPYLVKEDAMFGAGQLPKFLDDLFCTKDQYFLIPTGEVPLVNWVAGKVLGQLPLYLTALTPCFRAEAGSAGRDTHGMMRHHQFNKVELVIICHPEEAQHQHERLTRQAEILLERLNLPYRRMLLCSKDTGIVARKTYDIEVWLPSENRYREVSSCSECGDYQARRLQTKIKQDEGYGFVNMLNGSGLPTGRTLMAILENGQQEDGSVLIPEVLSPYMTPYMGSQPTPGGCYVLR